MTHNEFKRIVSVHITPDKIDKINYDNFNKEQYRNIYKNPNQIKYLYWDLNYSGNMIFTNKDGNRNLRLFYQFGFFSEEEWNTIIPHIFYNKYNKDFSRIEQKVIPLLDKIKEYKTELHYGKEYLHLRIFNIKILSIIYNLKRMEKYIAIPY